MINYISWIKYHYDKEVKRFGFFGLIGYQSEGNHNKERNLLLFHVCVDVEWKSSVEIQ